MREQEYVYDCAPGCLTAAGGGLFPAGRARITSIAAIPAHAAEDGQLTATPPQGIGHRPPVSGAGNPARLTAALRQPVFRAVWIGSLFSNFGLLVQGVGAAWLMAEISSPDRVGLVQTAALLPYLLFAIAAGALADMHDRRLVQIAALGFALAAAASLTAASWLGLLTPALLLLFCFLIGCGMAAFGPAWQASTSETVPQSALPAAIALNSISFNVARSFGPAVGGAIVATAGVSAAFLANALFYVPMLVILLRWRRPAEPPRLPPERLGGAIQSGLRYVRHSPPIRSAVLRAFLLGVIGIAPTALMPLVARDLIGGDARTFGMLLGAIGIGAVGGGSLLGRSRAIGSTERLLAICSAVIGVAILVTAFSASLIVTLPALLCYGGAWMMTVASLNIAVQVPSPRWVAGRTLATFQALIAGGSAIGAWGWGLLAKAEGTGNALIVAGVAMLCAPVLALVLRIADEETPDLREIDPTLLPGIALRITERSGPIVVELEYRVDPGRARAFYRHMQAVQRSRSRNGGYGWSLARGLADPELWVERFHCPTWADYLRHRARATRAEREQFDTAAAFHLGPDPIRVRRTLERPFGSVRWSDDARDEGATVDAATAAVGFVPGRPYGA